MRFLGVILMAMALVQQSDARASSTISLQPRGLYQIGENSSREAQLLNCRCAYLLNEGTVGEDLTCDNFRNNFQQAYMQNGGINQIQTPGQQSQPAFPQLVPAGHLGG